MSISYIEANTKGRERLCTLVSRRTDEELELQAGDGWTVAAILAHLAFWDNRALELIRRWKNVGVGRSPIDCRTEPNHKDLARFLVCVLLITLFRLNKKT